MGMSTQQYWAEIDAERAAKRDKDIRAAREAIGLDALKADAMLVSPDPVIERVNKIALECDDAILGLYETVGLVSPEARRQWQNDNCFEGAEDRAEHEARVRLMKGGA